MYIKRNTIEATVEVEMFEVSNECSPELSYLAKAELLNANMGAFCFLLVMVNDKNVAPLNSTFEDCDNGLLEEMMGLNLSSMTQEEKSTLVNRLSVVYCEKGCAISVDDLEQLHDVCQELNQIASDLLIEAFERDADYWAEQKSIEEEEDMLYQESCCEDFQ
tara:strand:+ start:35165 stop:35650 length:486 start_codon:yes stop_codon:yes gene_type:complete